MLPFHNFKRSATPLGSFETTVILYVLEITLSSTFILRLFFFAFSFPSFEVSAILCINLVAVRTNAITTRKMKCVLEIGASIQKLPFSLFCRAVFPIWVGPINLQVKPFLHIAVSFFRSSFPFSFVFGLTKRFYSPCLNVLCIIRSFARCHR